MSLLEVCFICWEIYESILFIVNILTFFVLCFLQFHVMHLHSIVLIFYIKKYLFLFILLVRQKRVLNRAPTHSHPLPSTPTHSRLCPVLLSLQLCIILCIIISLRAQGN